jgi:hypothetical protein
MRKTHVVIAVAPYHTRGSILVGLSCPGPRTRGFPCPFQTLVVEPVLKRRIDDLGVGRQIEGCIEAVKGEYAGCPGGEIG